MVKRSVRPCADCEEQESSEVLVETEGNAVFFYSPVSNASVLALNTALMRAAKNLRDQKNPIIYLFINSPGGDLYSGFSAMDHIESFPVPVHTIVDGYVASAATLIALAGQRRYVLPHAHLMVHQFSTTLDGKYEELLEQGKANKRLMKTFKETYLSKTNLTEEKLEKILARDTTFDAKRAIKWGFADEIYKGER